MLYEILVREVVHQTLSKNKEKRNKVVVILKEHFNSQSSMRKELILFKNLLETKDLSLNTAEKLIQETKKQYKKLDKKKLFKEQSHLIKVINKNLSKGVFNNFVPNYKSLATLSQIFNDDLNSKKRVLLEENILQDLTVSTATKKEKNNNQLSGLVMKKFVESYNKAYSDKLSAPQKQLLNKYILSFMDNGTDFKVYLNEEIGRLKEEINNSFKVAEIKEDNTMLQKMTKVKGILKESNKAPIDLDLIQKIVKIQSLVKEITTS